MADDALSARPHHLAALLASTVVALQIAYPLVHGAARDHLAVVIVTAFAGTCVVHAGITRGVRSAVALLAGTALPGYAVEVLGVHTGIPFGGYAYSSALGPRLFGVPPVIGLAWTMLAWPAALAARRLVCSPVARVLVGAWGLATADLFLDPQMVAAGYWRWHHPAPHLPGVAHVPLTDYAGWLAVALVLSVAVQAVAAQAVTAQALTGDRGGDAVPVALYLWLYVGWVIALAAFLHLPAAAAWGALGMGTVAVPLAVSLRR
jgi:uncharacterized membrane protein